MPRTIWFGFLVVALVFPGVFFFGVSGECRAAERDKIAIKAGTVIPVAGEILTPGMVLISGGKIEALGDDLEVPYDYWVLDLPERIVFPGMIEAFTWRGLDKANENLPVTPFLDVGDAIDPSSISFEDALRDGITTLLISQGPDTVIGGTARAVRPIGMTVDEMTVKDQAGIVLAFGPKSGHDRLVQMAIFRETFRELDEYIQSVAEKLYEDQVEEKGESIDVGPEKAAQLGRPLIQEKDLDFKHLNLYRLTQGKMRAFLHCKSALDVVHALRTAEKEGFLDRSVLVLENECFKAVQQIKASGRPVILDPGMVYRKVDPLTGNEEDIFVPKVFHDAGVPFAIRSDSSQSFGARYLWYQAARLVRNGIPRQTALEAVTLVPASLIGMGSRLGALQPGMDANLLVLSGDPLEGDTWVEKVFIQGCMVYEREKDYRLHELLTGEEIGPDESPEDDDSNKSGSEQSESPGDEKRVDHDKAADNDKHDGTDSEGGSRE